MASFLSAFLAFILIAGCGSKTDFASPSSRIEKHPARYRHTEFLRDQARFAKRNERGFSVRSYDLKGQFDWETKQLVATVDIAFRLECACQDSIVLDSSVSEIKDIFLKTNGQLLSYSQGAENTLTIDLTSVPEELRGKELVVSIRYISDANNTPEEGEHPHLIAIHQVAGDPVPSRVAYSVSEPRGASYWMPCVNDPRHRSRFSAEFRMPVGETLISNGILVRDEIVGAERWMKYQTQYTLPNYLMAFAVGEFTVATTHHGQLPVSIVARKGLPVDFTGLLKETVRQIATYEKLLVPFPFEKYMVVLLPEFSSGGIEHAGITFNSESSSSDSRLSSDLGLMAHELGHQWFGDLVTVETWDDLWIKEGMATLLTEESTRMYADQNGSRRLFGREFEVEEEEAILDTQLKPEDKYTSGPYGRSAWLLTQIRSYVGEEAFWSTLRKVLEEHRFGAIATKSFLDYFKPLVGEAFLAACQRSLTAKALPSLVVEEANGVFELKLSDEDGALVIPLEMRWYSENGSFEGELFSKGTTKQHLTADPRLLVLDVQDRHPIPSIVEGHAKGVLSTLLSPRTVKQENFIVSLGANHFLNGMLSEKPWSLHPGDFWSLYRKVPSEQGKFEFLQMGCTLAQTEKVAGGKIEEWRNVLHQALALPPYLGMPVSGEDPALSACVGVIDESVYAGLLHTIEANPADPLRPEAQVYFASLFSSAPDEAFRVWGKLARMGSSVRNRSKALNNLVLHLKGIGAFTKPGEKDLTGWKEYFRSFLNTQEASEVLEEALEGLKVLHDTESLPLIAKLLYSDLWGAWNKAYCTGVALSEENPEAKKLFEENFGNPTHLATWITTCKK